MTYDTGGADIKAGGVMAGMHRDKCGAAAVAGFFKVTNNLLLSTVLLRLDDQQITHQIHMYLEIFKDMKFFDVSFYIVKNKCKYLSFRILILSIQYIYMYIQNSSLSQGNFKYTSSAKQSTLFKMILMQPNYKNNGN